MYSRNVSAIERYNTVINELVKYNVDAVIEGRGELDPDQWKDAVARAAEANPGARVRWKSVLGFSQWVDSGIPPSVSLVEAPEWDGYSHVGAEFMQEKFDVLKGGPVCDIKLLPGDPARVVVRAAHGAMDARGITHFILEIFRALRGEPLIGSTDTVTDKDVRRQHSDKVKTTPNTPPESIPVIPPAENPKRPLRYVWKRATIDKPTANALPKAALFLARHAWRDDPDGQVTFTIPVDFRSLRHEVYSTANLTGYLRLEVKPDDRPRDIMRRINQQVRDYADCATPSHLNLLPWIPIRLLKKQLFDNVDNLLYTKNRDLPSGGIVSLGHLDPIEWSYPEFQAQKIFGIPGSVGKLNVVIHNYTDSTEVIFCTPEAYNQNGQLDELVNAFKSEFSQ